MKRLYHMLALLAMVNLFAVGGFIGYLFASGRLNAERVEQVAMVLRGEFPETEVAATQPAESEVMPEASQAEIARLQDKKEYYELLAERHKREMDDRMVLGKFVHLEVTRDLDELERQKKLLAEQKRALEEQSAQAGFEKELELFGKMDATMAKDLLRNRKDADVVRLLSHMDVNRAKKIIDACKKKEDDKLWIGRIVEQIPKLDQD